MKSTVGKLALGVAAVTALSGVPTAHAATPPTAVEAATAEAAKTGRAVPVPSLTDENSTTVANPDGTYTATITSGPSNVKQGGRWVPIDTSLVAEGGVLRPKAAKARIEVSGGGEGPLATMADEHGRTFSLRWPTALPAPRVQDNVATFADAAGPGADLVVTVLPTGFRHDVVLRTKPAGPIELRIPVRTEGVELSEAADGRLQLKSDSGEVVAAGARPVMWDAGGHGKPRGDAVAPVDAAVRTENGAKVLVLKPDEAFLSAPERVYPVTVDPTITLPGVEVDTDVATSWASHPGDPMIIAGTMPWENGQGGDVMRSLVRFDTAAFTGKRVLGAALAMWNVETNACGLRVGSGLTAERVTGPWDENNLNWDNKPATVTAGSSTVRAGRGRTWTEPCAGGAGFLTWGVTGIAQAWAKGAPNHGIQLRGADENEATNWRAFAASENKEEGVKPPTLAVVYSR
ncbi:DNRLRE domain-containing protein [Nonomuraea sp. SBT364]|uniref:DNRLRE domain-containing protein n=1 Tax=Nonomuraea sp. SBT364 TaxID=1580530 RepID=UPI000AA830AA|nr:DNRLRE domain-containing protein [Nonomuraea sp. SBT364]